jgi:isopentenyldiphosphate isomerase
MIYRNVREWEREREIEICVILTSYINKGHSLHKDETEVSTNSYIENQFLIQNKQKDKQ